MGDDEMRIADAKIGDDFSLQELLQSSKQHLLEEIKVEPPLDPTKIGMNMVGLLFPSTFEVPIEVFNDIKTKMEDECRGIIEACVGDGVPVAGFQCQHLATMDSPVPDIVDR